MIWYFPLHDLITALIFVIILKILFVDTSKNQDYIGLGAPACGCKNEHMRDQTFNTTHKRSVSDLETSGNF